MYSVIQNSHTLSARVSLMSRSCPTPPHLTPTRMVAANFFTLICRINAIPYPHDVSQRGVLY